MPGPRELASEPGPGTLTALADIIEPMGHETLVHGAEAGRDIRVVVPRGVRIGAGARLHLRPKPNQLHLFDPAGRRIEP